MAMNRPIRIILFLLALWPLLAFAQSQAPVVWGEARRYLGIGNIPLTQPNC
jgi:hypothetical protein